MEREDFVKRLREGTNNGYIAKVCFEDGEIELWHVDQLAQEYYPI